MSVVPSGSIAADNHEHLHTAVALMAVALLAGTLLL